MENPTLVEVTRGSLVESRHRGAVSIFDADGKKVLLLGDTEARVFPRSAIKALQALPLVESGAADALDYDEAELALACASHNGEEVHARGARVMLMKAGLSEEALECGPQWPKRMEDAAKLIQENEKPCALHNNCSGKHAAFLGLARTMGAPTEGYVNPEHAVQQEIKLALEQMTGDTLTPDICGTDGCSIPTYATALDRYALAFARFGTGEGLEEERAKACECLYEACVNEAYFVAGAERFCTDIMNAFRGRVFVKTGAEGVFCASVPELGLGVALKCEDGATRAAEVMMATVLQGVLDVNDEEDKVLVKAVRPDIVTRRGAVAGVVRPTEGFINQLTSLAN